VGQVLAVIGRTIGSVPAMDTAASTAQLEGSSMKSMERISIIGAGLMGNGIAAVFAAKGHEVTLYDPIPAALEAAPGRVAGVLKDLAWDADAIRRVKVEGDLAKAVADAARSRPDNAALARLQAAVAALPARA